MSTELSKLDRKLVHEIAEELGLHHQSDGVEGVDRRIKLSLIPSDDDERWKKILCQRFHSVK